jgi:hypothetical protein
MVLLVPALAARVLTGRAAAVLTPVVSAAGAVAVVAKTRLALKPRHEATITPATPCG